MQLSLEIVARTLFDTEVTADIRSINDEVNTIMGIYNFDRCVPTTERLSPSSDSRHHEVSEIEGPAGRDRGQAYQGAPRSWAGQGRPAFHVAGEHV